MQFDVLPAEQPLKDTFRVVLSKPDDTEAVLHFSARKFGRFINRTGMFQEVDDHLYAARTRTTMRLGRIRKMPTEEQVEAKVDVEDEEWDATLKEELANFTDDYSAPAIRKRFENIEQELPQKLARCMVNWENVTVNGEEIAFSYDHAESLLSMPNMADSIVGKAMEAFGESMAARKELEGNSDRSSGGESSTSGRTEQKSS